MSQVSITTVVRNALLKNAVRNYAYNDVMAALDVPRHIAKKLCFSFLYFAEEETLAEIIRTGFLPNEIKKAP